MAERPQPQKAQDKLAFLLSLVPYLMDHDRVSVADAAVHFGDEVSGRIGDPGVRTLLAVQQRPIRRPGRLGVEQGLAPDSAAEFDRYDELRARQCARITHGGYDGRTAMAIADTYLRGDIAVIEDVATLRRAQGRGLGSAAVLGATAAALRLSARAVYLFANPDTAEGFYEPLGFERIATAWECQKEPPDERPRGRPHRRWG